MPNVTISIEEKILKASRAYAKEHGLSLNALIREILSRTISRSSTHWIDECYAFMDSLKVDSRGKTWDRNDLYDL